MSSTSIGGARPLTVDRGSAQALRKFGFVMAGALGVLGGIAAWRGRTIAWALLVAAAVFLLTALARPRALRGVERVWMRFAEFLGRIMTLVLLTVTYVLVITPIGVVRRLLRKDSLGLQFDSTATTYWVPVDPEGANRPDKPY